MIKHYCDKCGEEITDINRMTQSAFRTVIKDKDVTLLAVEVMPLGAFSFKPDEPYQVCKYCVLDAINEKDDRFKITCKNKHRHSYQQRSNAHHILKTDPDQFHYSWLGKKNFEIRYNDRDYKVGQTITLRETYFTGKEMEEGSPLEYTGREIDRRIMHITEGSTYGLAEGWVVMALCDI